MDFEQEVNISKHIQCRRYKNLIEIIVDGPKVRERELFVLAHFIAKRTGKLYYDKHSDLHFLMYIDSKTSDTSVARRMLRQLRHHKIQHFILRPRHHTQGHPIGGALAHTPLYKKHIGGRISLEDVGEGMRKMGRTTGRIMTVGGAAALAGTPIVAVAAPAAVPAYAAIAGSVGAAGLILHKGLAKHPDLTQFSV